MNIHPLWFICIAVRIGLAVLILKNKNTKLDTVLVVALALMTTGFFYKALTGSNDEKQIAQVFWHNTRLLHATFYFFAFFCLLQKKKKLSAAMVAADVVFSIIYRIVTDK